MDDFTPFSFFGNYEASPDFQQNGFNFNDPLSLVNEGGESQSLVPQQTPEAFSSLAQLFSGDLSKAGFNGPTMIDMGTGGDGQSFAFNPAFTDFLQNSGLHFGFANQGGGSMKTLANLFDSSNNPIGKQVSFSTDAGPLWDAAVSLAAGVATGGLGAGLGMSGLGGAALSGAAGGGLSAGLTGGDPLKGALFGAAGGGMSSFNPAQSMGITNPTIGSITNRAITGAGNSLLQGGNPLQGALKGAASGGIRAGLNFGADQLGLNGNTTPSSSQGGNMEFFDGTTGDSAFENPINSGGAFNSPLNSMLGQSQAAPGMFSRAGGDLALDSSPQTQGTSFASQDFFDNPQQDTQTSGGNPITEMLASAMGGMRSFNSSVPGGVGNLVGGLAGLYSGFQQRKRAAQLAGQLNDMFSANSPYAQQLRQQLVRKDAAAGRRSQYGPREVELQARLAEMNSRNAPQLANLFAAQNQGTERMLSNGIRMAQNFGLFGPQLSNRFDLGPNAGPQLEGI